MHRMGFKFTIPTFQQSKKGVFHKESGVCVIDITSFADSCIPDDGGDTFLLQVRAYNSRTA